MRNLPIISILIMIILSVFSLSGCGNNSPTAGGGVPTAATGIITGFVTDSRGGGAVVGASVSLQGTTLSTTTNASGVYVISNVPPGTYTLIVTQTGNALSQAQGIVAANNTTATVNIISMPAFNPAWNTSSAPVISITGVSPNILLSGSPAYTINAVGANAIDTITLYINNAKEKVVTASQSISGVWDTTRVPNGSVAVRVVAYDINGNRNQIDFNVSVANTAAGAIPLTPTCNADAITYSKSLKLFALQQSAAAQLQGIIQSPNQIVLPKRQGLPAQTINIMAAPPNSTIFVDITVSASISALKPITGFKFYAAPSAAGPYTLIGTKPAANLNVIAVSLFTDFSPSLQAGVSRYYKVSSYNSAGESPLSAAVAATPLPPFNVSLVSPANASTGVSTAPVFGWSANTTIGQFQEYSIHVFGQNSMMPEWDSLVTGVTSVGYNADGLATIPVLNNLTIYHWNIYFARAYNLDANGLPTAESFCGDLTYGGAVNGAFSFTTL